MPFLLCFGSRRRLAKAASPPVQPAPHHARAHSAGPLTKNPVIASPKDSLSHNSTATLDPEVPSVVPSSSGLSAQPATLSGLLRDEDDDVKSITKHKKHTTALRRVTNRIRRRFSRDSMPHQGPRQINQEGLNWRAELKHRHRRMIVEELLQEEERAPAELCLSELDAALAVVAEDQRAGRLKVACRPRDNIEFAVTPSSAQQLQQAQQCLPVAALKITNNAADPNYPVVCPAPTATSTATVAVTATNATTNTNKNATANGIIPTSTNTTTNGITTAPSVPNRATTAPASNNSVPPFPFLPTPPHSSPSSQHGHEHGSPLPP